jgi:uncharacterized protein (DUF488 family)
MSETTVWTVGHSNRSIEEFINLLQLNLIECILDIRTVPKSKNNPQFGQDELSEFLINVGIGYQQIPCLGGLRRPQPDTLNGGWRNTSFRGYADYMQTIEFTLAVEGVIELSRTMRCALMCAEAVPWRCHRSLVGDALIVRGIAVLEIIGQQQPRSHKLTPFAHVDGSTITYPPEMGNRDEH